MKRNLTLLAALLAVTLTLGIGPAAAGSWTWGAAPRGQRRSLVGEIAGKTADSFVLKRRTGQTDTIMVTRTTSYRERNRRTTFAALQPGMRVSVMARQSEGVTTAVIVASVGVLSVGSVLYCGLIMFGILFAFMNLNKMTSHAGATYAWVGA
ncbi:MAG: hypothetical protein NTZ05_22205, partial [Chloroflexi bacterium]|nr:hypothetical protein [Chloroflexota bacterium]